VEVSGRPVVIVSGIAAVVMAAAVIVLRGEADDDDSGDALAMRAVLLDTIADVASAAGVAVVGVIMAVTHGWFWLDAAVALVVSLVVGSHAAALVRTVTTTLRAGGEAARAE
jgi:cobalt-zinc-cadmium efflux system protein